jgi:hypothetical protein
MSSTPTWAALRCGRVISPPLVGATPVPIAQFAYYGNKSIINHLGILMLVGGGKTAVLDVLNTAMPRGLGKIVPNDGGAVQKMQVSVSELLGGPVYWQRSVADGGPLLYNWGMNDAVKAFPFNGTTFATTPSAQGSVTHQIRPGGGPVNVVVTVHPDARSHTLSGGFTYHHQHRFAVLRLELRLLPTLRQMYFARSTA